MKEERDKIFYVKNNPAKDVHVERWFLAALLHLLLAQHLQAF